MSPADPIRVAVIDDNRLVREGLAALLNRLANIRAAAHAHTTAAIRGELRPHVLLLDFGLGGEETSRIAKTLLQQAPDVKIVVMDLIPVTEETLELVNAGVSGFVMKEASFEEFV